MHQKSHNKLVTAFVMPKCSVVAVGKVGFLIICTKWGFEFWGVGIV